HGNQYITSTSGGRCHTSGEGGHITATCSLPEGGRVVLQENNLGSWKATVNGVPTPVLREGQWVAIDAPAGDVSISFRYAPRDFWAGLAASLLGLAIAVTLILMPSRYRFHFSWKRRNCAMQTIHSSG